MDDFIFIVSIILGMGCIFMCIAFGIHEIAEAKRNKPKEDDLQKLLNAVNDRIIDLSNLAEQDMETQIRKCDFHYFKGMILGLMEERKKKKSDGPIITEELWNRWHKTKEKEEIDFNNIEETFKDDFKEKQEEFIKTLYEKSEKVKEEMVIDDIIMIYTLCFEKYEDYFKHKEETIEAIRIAKQTPMYYGNKCGFTYYVEPIILSEETFNYIIEKRGIKKK